MTAHERAAALDRIFHQIAPIEADLRAIREMDTNGSQRPNGPGIAESGKDRVRFLQSILQFRRARSKFMPQVQFGEPAWDMLVELRLSQLRGRPVSVTSLTLASGVPATTALRYIAALVHQGVILRDEDPNDGRRTWLALSNEARDDMDRFFDEAIATFRA